LAITGTADCQQAAGLVLSLLQPECTVHSEPIINRCNDEKDHGDKTDRNHAGRGSAGDNGPLCRVVLIVLKRQGFEDQ